MSYAQPRIRSQRPVGPGIDVSHYGAPYQGMLGLGATPWTGAPSEDPRMVRSGTVVRSTFTTSGIGGSTTPAMVASVLEATAREAFHGSTVRKIGSTGWIAGGRVGYDVTLSSPMRAGLVKQTNYRVGKRAEARLGGQVKFLNGRTLIPDANLEDAPSMPGPSVPSEAASSPGASSSRRIMGLPVWAVALLGTGVVGGAAALLWKKSRAK